MFTSRYFLSWVYLLFAISGLIFPTLANIDFIREYGTNFDIYKFINLANINPAAQSLSRDLIIGAGAVTLWIIIESRRLKMKNMQYVIGSFLIAFAFAAPMFLCLRERRLIEIEEKNV